MQQQQGFETKLNEIKVFEILIAGENKRKREQIYFRYK